jgi:hypothetical protein
MGKPRTFKGEIATFRRVAKQRFLSAEYLERGGYNLDAIYLAGYSVECILKALILENTAVGERESVFQRITKGAAMHSPEVLGALLKDVGAPIPSDLKERIRSLDWLPSLR